MALSDTLTPRIENWECAVSDTRERYMETQKERLNELNIRRIYSMFRAGDTIPMSSKYLTWHRTRPVAPSEVNHGLIEELSETM